MSNSSNIMGSTHYFLLLTDSGQKLRMFPACFYSVSSDPIDSVFSFKYIRFRNQSIPFNVS